MRRDTLVWAAAAAWLAAVAGGFWAWERYDRTPGAAAPAGPTEATGAWVLTIYIHPRCPCAKASLAEFREVVRAAPGVDPRVVVARPAGVPAGWERGELWDTATGIAGVRVVADEGGAEAARAGARTSGHAVLSDPGGAVVFAGGLTPARGRTGDGPGRRAVVGWVTGRGDRVGAAPVYGCPLFGPDGCCGGEGDTCQR